MLTVSGQRTESTEQIQLFWRKVLAWHGMAWHGVAWHWHWPCSVGAHTFMADLRLRGRLRAGWPPTPTQRKIQRGPESRYSISPRTHYASLHRSHSRLRGSSSASADVSPACAARPIRRKSIPTDPSAWATCAIHIAMDALLPIDPRADQWPMAPPPLALVFRFCDQQAQSTCCRVCARTPIMICASQASQTGRWLSPETGVFRDH
jgi:hypothetical protein